MSESFSMTINQSERAELEALLERWRIAFDQDKADHEKIEAQIEYNIREAKRLTSPEREGFEPRHESGSAFRSALIWLGSKSAQPRHGH